MAWNLLLNSDYGLFSLFVIVFCIVMAIVMGRYYTKKMNETPQQ